MPVSCSTNYDCTPIWYTADDSAEGANGVDIVAVRKGPHAADLNVTCQVNTGTVQFQVRDSAGDWFTPSEASYTVSVSNLVRLPRSNMPDVRILATGDATFYVEGSLD